MKKKIIIGIVCLIIVSVGGLYFFYGLGRTPSRMLGKSYRQVITIPGKFIDISSYKLDGSTIKDITFMADDGFPYTQEFKDFSLLNGTIRWVPYGTGSDFIRSRVLSRWTGGVVNLELPEDFQEMLGVKVGLSTSDERVKNLVYRTKDGRILYKEYRDGIIDRHMEGWLEIKENDGVDK